MVDLYPHLPDIALSVRQPWTHALAHQWKPVENRSWRRGNPGLTFRGAFALHAGIGMTRDEYRDCVDFFADRGFACPPAVDLQRGGIVGVATVVDAVRDHPSPWFFGPWALVVADARPIPFIKVGGQLGFFNWKRLLPFADRGKPVVPARWMLPPDPAKTKQPPAKPAPQRGLFE